MKDNNNSTIVEKEKYYENRFNVLKSYFKKINTTTPVEENDSFFEFKSHKLPIEFKEPLVKNEIINYKDDEKGKKYLDDLFKVPFFKYSKNNLDIIKASEIINSSHYGMDKVKDAILEYVTSLNYKNKDSNDTPILCLVGAPGVGKTSIFNSLAKALGRELYKISLSGVSTISFLAGSFYSYNQSSYGQIINSLITTKTMNPIVLLDEIDKISDSTNNGDVKSFLLSVLDKSQNKKFVDNYFMLPIDISDILFVATANYIEKIPEALKNRMKIIEINNYLPNEKKEICKKYIIPNINKSLSNLNKEIILKDDAIDFLIKNYSNEAGVRNLKKKLINVYEKIILNYKKIKTDRDSLIIDEHILKELLKDDEYNFNNLERVHYNKYGVVNAVIISDYVGKITSIETITVNSKIFKKDNIIWSSYDIAINQAFELSLEYIRCNAKEFGVEEFDFNFFSFVWNIISDTKFLSNSTNDQKGVMNTTNNGIIEQDSSLTAALTTSILSSMKKEKIDENTVIIGEITLTGLILGCDSILKRVTSCINNKIKRVFVPKDNEDDIKNSKLDLNGTKIIYVEKYMDIYNEIFKH